MYIPNQSMIDQKMEYDLIFGGKKGCNPALKKINKTYNL